MVPRSEAAPQKTYLRHIAETMGSLSLGVQRPLTTSGVLILLFRWVVIACQALTLHITWPLWQIHETPPMLPALGLPAFDMGFVLLVSLVLIFFMPLLGISLHTILMAYAMLMDQTRIQPEFVSLIFLLWGSLPSPTARGFARAHLISLWCFAGLHKLVSPRFLHDTSQWMLEGLETALHFQANGWLQANIGYGIASTEIGLGLLATIPRTRTIAAAAAFIVHVMILLVLMPTGHDWNEAVWPWNAALALAGFAIIMPWKTSPLSELLCCHRVARPLIVSLMVVPIGFYVGITDAYIAHHLYSSNTARATSTALDIRETWNAFNVPLPPEHRLFKQYFEKTCQPGDLLTITDSRWWYQDRGLESQQFSCPTDIGLDR